MDIDTTVKLIYAIGITGSVVAVAFFLIRLMIKVGRRVDEMEETTRNVGEMTDRINEQMDTIEGIVNGVKGISDNIIQPLSAVAGTLKYVKDIVNSFGMPGREAAEEETDTEEE